MTIINGIEIDITPAPLNDIRKAILQNKPIDTVLHVVMVVSNPCQYARRYILAREFIARMKHEANVRLYIVELAYDHQKFYVTKATNNRHLQLRAAAPLWHKENMINVGIRTLLPKSWKAVAWIDADVEFENTSWALDTLKILNGCRDIVQPFSHCINMDREKNTLDIFPSFGFQYATHRPHGLTGINMWHPGFAWACTRAAYDQIGGLYDASIMGCGDHIMALAFAGHSHESMHEEIHPDYQESVESFQRRARGLVMGYAPGLIRHHYHGSIKNRQYDYQWHLLVRHQYSPADHIRYRKDGLIVSTAACPSELLTDIMTYFQERNEDED